MSSRTAPNSSPLGVARPPHRARLLNAFEALYSSHKSGERVSSIEVSSASSGFQEGDREEFFAEDIVFRDPMMQTTGLNDYKVQFASLHSVCRMELQLLSITEGKGAPLTLTGKPSTEKADVIIIDANCTYKFNRFIQFTIRQVSRLALNKDGKIQSHEDIWSVGDSIANLPIVGRIYRGAQTYAGRAFCALINGAYAFRAGVPLRSAQLRTNTIHAAYHPITSQKHGQQAESGAGGGAITSVNTSIGAVRDTVAASATNAVNVATSAAHNITSYVSSHIGRGGANAAANAKKGEEEEDKFAGSQKNSAHQRGEHKARGQSAERKVM